MCVSCRRSDVHLNDFPVISLKNEFSLYEAVSIYLIKQHEEIRIQLFEFTWLVNEKFRVLEHKNYVTCFAVYCLSCTLLCLLIC